MKPCCHAIAAIYKFDDAAAALEQILTSENSQQNGSGLS